MNERINVKPKAKPIFKAEYYCPTTGETVSDRDMMYSDGVCHECGDLGSATVTHAKKRSVKAEPVREIIHNHSGLWWWLIILIVLITWKGLS